MKNLFLLVAAVAFIVACGPSAEDKAAEAKRIADSTMAAEATMRSEDSLTQIAAQATLQADSMAKAAVEAAEKVKADSITAAAAKKPGIVKKVVKKVQNAVRVNKEGQRDDVVKSVNGNGGRAGATKIN